MYDKAEVIGIELVVDGETIVEWSNREVINVNECRGCGEETEYDYCDECEMDFVKWREEQNKGEKQGNTSSF